MTREELCDLLVLPGSTPAAELAQARTRRAVEIQDLLRQDDLPKPVKIKLQQERAMLESADGLGAELEIIGRIEAFFAEIAAELAKPGPVRGVVRLCLGRLKPLILEVKDEATRFGYEKQLVEIEERLSRIIDPGDKSADRGALADRIEAYFAEVAAELAKPDPGRGVIRLCLGKLKPLVEEIKDEAARYGFEKRLVQIEDRLGLRVSTAPFLFAKDRKLPGGKTDDKGGAGPAPWESGGPMPAPPPAPPSGAAPAPVRGTLLQLTPARVEGTLRQPGPPVHLVAKPRFLLGRRRASVDFVTWFLPENAENRQKTDTISRVNTTLFLKGNQIWVQDGELLENGKTKPSAHGTIIDGQAITTAHALNFTKERRLKFGQYGYELAAVQLPAVSPGGPRATPAATLSTQPTQALPQRPLGCVRFLPITCREVYVAAVWMFSEASLGSGAQCAVRLDSPNLPPVAVRFHHWQDGFWLEVPAGGKSVVTLDGRELAAGAAVPLQAVHQLRLGDFEYELRVS